MGVANSETIFDFKVSNLKIRYDIEKVSEGFTGIQKIIIKSLQSVQKVILNDKHSFELYINNYLGMDSIYYLILI